MGAAGNGRATRQRGVQEIVQARGVVIHTNNLTNLRTYELTNLRTYKLTLRVRASHFGLSSHKPVEKTSQQTQVQHRNLRGRGTCRNAPKRPCQRQVHHRGGAPCKQLERVQGTERRQVHRACQKSERISPFWVGGYPPFSADSFCTFIDT